MKISFGFQNSVTKLPTKVDLVFSLFRDHSSRGGNSLRLKDAHPPWRPPEKRQQRQRVRHELLRGRTARETDEGC